MTLRDRLAAAFALGTWGALIAWFGMSAAPEHVAKDFTWPWRAARALLAGQDPYQVIQATGEYPFNVGFLYPLPAGVLAVPFAPFPPAVAGALFVGLSAAALGFAVAREAPHRLLLFASAPFCMAALLGQWSPILMAAAFLPALQFVCAAKPTIGLATWLYRPSWKGAAGAVVLVAASLIVLPRWPFAWREALEAATSYKGPALTLAGSFTLLAALRWRQREGRLVLALALVPQLPLFYDQLPLWLVPQTRWRSLALTVSSWAAFLAWYPSRALETSLAAARPWVLALIWAPALVMLLWPARAASEAPPAT